MAPPIGLGPLLFSVNLYAATPALGDQAKAGTVQVSQCQGDITIKGVCDPICDAIFSDVPDHRKQVELATKYFGGTCDSVCQCICDTICDAII